MRGLSRCNIGWRAEDPIGLILVWVDRSAHDLLNGGVSESIEGFETVVPMEVMVLRRWRLLTVAEVL